MQVVLSSVYLCVTTVCVRVCVRALARVCYTCVYKRVFMEVKNHTVYYCVDYLAVSYYCCENYALNMQCRSRSNIKQFSCYTIFRNNFGFNFSFKPLLVCFMAMLFT